MPLSGGMPPPGWAIGRRDAARRFAPEPRATSFVEAPAFTLSAVLGRR